LAYVTHLEGQLRAEAAAEAPPVANVAAVVVAPSPLAQVAAEAGAQEPLGREGATVAHLK